MKASPSDEEMDTGNRNSCISGPFTLGIAAVKIFSAGISNLIVVCIFRVSRDQTW
jgi:hypothetical protein